MHEPTVYIIDDDDITTASIRAIVEGIGYRVVAYSDALEFLDKYSSQQSGCLLLDLCMPKMSGLELQAELGKRQASIPIIFITGHADVSSAVRAMKAHAMDFLTKPVNIQVLIETIHKAIKQDAHNRDRRAQRQEVQQRLQQLTPREHQVMELVVAGKSTKEVAECLHISPNTVEIHRSKIMHKMEAKSVANLVNLVYQAKLSSDS